MTYNSPQQTKNNLHHHVKLLIQSIGRSNFTETKSHRQTCLKFQRTYQSTTSKAPKTNFKPQLQTPPPNTGGNNLATTQTLVSAVMLGNCEIRHRIEIPLAACCNSNLANGKNSKAEIGRQTDRQTDRNNASNQKEGSTSAPKPKPNLLLLCWRVYDLSSQMMSDMDKRDLWEHLFLYSFSSKVGAHLVGLCIR